MKSIARVCRSRFSECALGLIAVLIGAQPAAAAFHLAVIDELMTSHGGDAAVQFVEIRMLSGGQGIVGGSKLAAFAADGSFVSVVLTVPSNVSSGADRRWIMATGAFETASGLEADFNFAGGLPSGDGMVCWGKPGNETSANSYVDCVSYGSYTGAPNNHTGAPSAQTPDGHSLRRTGDTASSAVDFECADPADPENNAGETEPLVATVPCSGATTTTTTSTSSSTSSTASSTSTSSSTTSTLPAVTCGDGTGDGSVTATDALLALSTAVGAQSCALCLCDVDSSGSVAATDALRILSAAVGAQVDLVCVPC